MNLEVGVQYKKCSRCGETKEYGCFVKAKERKHGIRPECKDCSNKWQRKYRDRPHIKAKNRLMRATPEFKQKQREYNQTPEAMRKNLERSLTAWHKNPVQRERIRNYQRKRRQESPKIQIQHNMATAVGDILAGRKNRRSWEALVGYTAKELMRHLEKQFKKGMSWDNYGRGGWHIDHIIPVSVFNFADVEHMDFKRCWALDNLRPLWETENLSKNNKLDKPFQPALALDI